MANQASSNPTAADLSALYAGQAEKGAIKHERKSFEGLGTVIPNPIEGAGTHVLFIASESEELYFVHPTRQNRDIFSSMRDLAIEEGGVEARVDSVGNLNFSGMGYEIDEESGEIVPLDEEYECAEIANFAHRTYSTTAQAQSQSDEFGAIELFRKPRENSSNGRRSRRRRGRQQNQGPRLTEFASDYLDALEQSASGSDWDRVGALTVLVLTAFSSMFEGVDEQGVVKAVPGDTKAMVFRSHYRRALTGKEVPESSEGDAERDPAEAAGPDIDANQAASDDVDVQSAEEPAAQTADEMAAQHGASADNANGPNPGFE